MFPVRSTFDPERPCVVVPIKGWLRDITHLVMRDTGDTVETKCGKTAPASDSYTGKYGNIDCATCRRGA